MDDLVSREMVRKVMLDMHDHGPTMLTKSDISRWVDMIPAEKPRTKCIAEIRLEPDELLDRIEEKHGLVRRDPGKWEDEGISSSLIEEWQSARCSNCGKYHTTPYLYYFKKYDYCPSCGAYMGGETDG